MDGEKMECSHSREDVDFYLQFFHKQYENVDPKTWDAFSAISHSQMVSAPVLIGNTVIKTDWLSSGYPGTADINCIKMAILVSCIVAVRNKTHNVDHLSPDEWAKIEEAYGSQHKSTLLKRLLEKGSDWTKLIQQGALDPIFAMQGVTMKTELVQNDVLGTLDRELYVDLDFLGFGVRYFGPFHEQGIKLEFPTLSIKRLRAAIGFSKAEKGYNLNVPEQYNDYLVATLAKDQSLYLFGGFMEPEINRILNAAFVRTLR